MRDSPSLSTLSYGIRMYVSALIILSHIISTGQMGYSGTGTEGQAIQYKYIIKKINDEKMTVTRCLQHCLPNCMCFSFQICNKTECQLTRARKQLVSQKNCTHYKLLRDKPQAWEEGHHQCTTGCARSINCCIMSTNPCRYGGKCLPPKPNYRWQRFQCECPDGFYKLRCNKPIQSCEDRWKNGARVSGKYQILDRYHNFYDVYCHFDRDLNVAWTLVQSYRRDKHANMTSLLHDQEISNGSSFWDEYRLSRSNMATIQGQSTKWRITCQYDKLLGNKSDVIYGQKTEINILQANQGCIRVEYIDVLGKNCSNCTVFLHQDNLTILHHHYNESEPCDYAVTSSSSEDCGVAGYFGSYSCVDEAHVCSQSPSATAQTWLGREIS